MLLIEKYLNYKIIILSYQYIYIYIRIYKVECWGSNIKRIRNILLIYYY